MPEATDQLAPKRSFFGVPGSWVGRTPVALAILALAGVFNRRLTGGFRGVFAGLVLARVVALVAVLRKKERSILIWISSRSARCGVGRCGDPVPPLGSRNRKGCPCALATLRILCEELATP
jgi:hypothetical protein